MTSRVIIFIFFLISFFSAKNALAVTTSISDYPSSISSDPFTIKVNVSGANAGTNYLRIDLYRSSTTNYFGETFNGLGWYSDNEYTQYFAINIESDADWSGEIQGRLGNPTSTQYDNTGSYKLRIRRYTSSGNYSSTEANNSAVDVNIEVLFSIPSPNSIPSESPQPTQNVDQPISPTSDFTPQIYNNVYLSEAMVAPEIGDQEWIEIYNGNDFEVELNNWYVDDLENSGSTPKLFFLNIPAKSYSYFDISNNIFNNSGDSVRLLDFNQKEIDSFQFSSSDKGKSWGRTSFENDNFCLQISTKNNPNSVCLNPTNLPTVKPTPTLSSVFSAIKNPTINPTPSNLLTKIIPTKYFIITQNFPGESTNLEKPSEDVLGLSTEGDQLDKLRNNPLIFSLSFVSVAYSLLAMTSIVYKIKINS